MQYAYKKNLHNFNHAPRANKIIGSNLVIYQNEAKISKKNYMPEREMI